MEFTTASPGYQSNSRVLQLMKFIYKLIEICVFDFRFCTLAPGDIILTGTPPGVGAFAKPPVFLKVVILK